MENLPITLSANSPPKKDGIAAVQETVAKIFGVSLPEINGHLRTDRISFARSVSMYLCYKKYHLGKQADIGYYHGNKDHGTVIWGIKRVEREFEIKQRRDFKMRYDACVSVLARLFDPAEETEEQLLDRVLPSAASSPQHEQKLLRFASTPASHSATPQEKQA